MPRRLLCPSAPCTEGAILVGVVLADGRVAFAAEETRIDAEFVSIARAGRAPEARFRFASPCARGACRQWTGTRCGVIDDVLEEVPTELRASATPGVDALPACSIRAECRWFDQSGADACAVCPVVITDAGRSTSNAEGSP